MSTKSQVKRTSTDKVALFIVVSLIAFTLVCDLVRVLVRKARRTVHSNRSTEK